MPNKQILMIGPNSQGGITSVIKVYLNNGLDEVEFLPSVPNFFIFLVKYLVKMFDQNIKLVHIHSASRGSFLRKSIVFYIAKLFGKKTIFHIHGAEFNIFYDNYPAIVKKTICDVLKKADIVLALSKQWQKDLTQKSSSANVKVLYNPNILKPKEEKPAKDTVNVLFMGRIGKRKGVYDILKAAELVNDNVKITLYGDGETGLSGKRVTFGGWIGGSDVDKAYKEADIYILPSYNEGLPMSVLEAMSYGLPVISTPVGGTPEAVIDDENGFLIEPGDYKALAEKINLLAENKALREQFGQKSYEISAQKFDINVILRELRDIYAEILH